MSSLPTKMDFVDDKQPFLWISDEKQLINKYVTKATDYNIPLVLLKLIQKYHYNIQHFDIEISYAPQTVIHHLDCNKIYGYSDIFGIKISAKNFSAFTIFKRIAVSFEFIYQNVNKNSFSVATIETVLSQGGTIIFQENITVYTTMKGLSVYGAFINVTSNQLKKKKFTLSVRLLNMN